MAFFCLQNKLKRFDEIFNKYRQWHKYNFAAYTIIIIVKNHWNLFNDVNYQYAMVFVPDELFFYNKLCKMNIYI